MALREACIFIMTRAARSLPQTRPVFHTGERQSSGDEGALVDIRNLGYSPRLPEGNIYDAPCPLLRALSVIGGKWELPLLWHIAEHTEAACGVRYNALKRAVHGITNTMLNKCLAECERDGLITREERGKRPPHVEYRLTERGRALLPALRELYIWGQGLLEKTPKE